MRTTATHEPRVVHAIPGRVRLHLPGRRWGGWSHVESRLRQVPGVRSARANPRTGNVLVHFDPAKTSPAALLAALRSCAGVRPAAPRLTRLLLRMERARRAHSPGAAGAFAGLVFALARDLLAGLDHLTRPSNLLAHFADSPLAREFLAHFLGSFGAELLCRLTAVLARALAGDLFSVLGACLKALLWLAGA